MPLHLSSKVKFFQDGADSKIRDKKRLSTFIISLFKTEEKELKSINYIFCTDKKIREINREYLNHDYFTDIITFQLSNKKEPIISEIFISVDRVRDNSKNLEISYKSEIHRVMFHGALHLCGYKDHNERESRIIREKEDFYLHKYFQ